MKRRDVRSGAIALLAACGLGIVFLTGCVTGPKIDWDSQVGHYTYDKAVLEMGPPDRTAVLTDGTRVAEWLTARGYSRGYVGGFAPTLHHPYFYSAPAFYYSEPPSPDRFLRLTFGADGRMVTWRRVYR